MAKRGRKPLGENKRWKNSVQFPPTLGKAVEKMSVRTGRSYSSTVVELVRLGLDVDPDTIYDENEALADRVCNLLSRYFGRRVGNAVADMMRGLSATDLAAHKAMRSELRKWFEDDESDEEKAA